MTIGFSADELAGIDLIGIVTYLRSTGWQERDRFARTIIWTRAVDGDEAEVLVPDNSQLRGYAGRVAELVSTLSSIEQRPTAAILRDLASTMVDVQYIRLTPNGPAGTTPLHEGYLAVKGVRDLFLFCATSAVSTDRLAVLPSSKPTEAQDFLEQVRLGQTEKGSYVLRVETPLQLENVAATLSTREMLLHLYQAASSAYEATVEALTAESLAPFADRVADGVSANVCEALSNIGGRQNSPFEIRFSWAPASPTELITPIIQFESEHIRMLKQGGAYLRKLPLAERVTVAGGVVDLHRTPMDRLGKVQIDGVVDRSGTMERNRITMRLTQDWYHHAVVAHQEQRQLRVTGDLRYTGRQYEMSRVSSVEIIN